jgi:hypothetical protein
MTNTSAHQRSSGALLAGAGAIAFSVLTLVAIFVVNAPGGDYSTTSVNNYLAHGHRIPVLVATHLAIIGVFGLICLLAYLREAIGAESRLAANIVWGAGLAAAASFAIGWGVIGGQVIAHLEGGSKIATPPAITYLISQIGVVMIFGSGAILLGFALIALMLNSRAMMPTWLRRSTLLAGVCGVAGMAFFTFFLFIIGLAVVGVWLVTTARHATAPALAAQAGA